MTGHTEGSKGTPQAGRRKITVRCYIYVSIKCGMTYRASHDSARDRTGRVLCACKNSRCQELCLGGNWSESSIQQMRQSAAGRKEDGCVRRQGSMRPTGTHLERPSAQTTGNRRTLGGRKGGRKATQKNRTPKAQARARTATLHSNPLPRFSGFRLLQRLPSGAINPARVAAIASSRNAAEGDLGANYQKKCSNARIGPNGVLTYLDIEIQGLTLFTRCSITPRTSHGPEG